jgi:hypothetical protein
VLAALFSFVLTGQCKVALSAVVRAAVRWSSSHSSFIRSCLVSATFCVGHVLSSAVSAWSYTRSASSRRSSYDRDHRSSRTLLDERRG